MLRVRKNITDCVKIRQQPQVQKNEATAEVPAFLLLTSRGSIYWLQKEVHLYENQYEIEPTSHLMFMDVVL